VVQEAQLHVLAPKGSTGIVFLSMAANLVEHLGVDFELTAVGKQIERLSRIEVVVELAVRPDTWESPTVNQAPFPQATEPPVGNVLISPDHAQNLRSRTEPVAEDGIENLEVAIRHGSWPGCFGPDEF
jgi:hypothetical protein